MSSWATALSTTTAPEPANASRDTPLMQTRRDNQVMTSAYEACADLLMTEP